MPNAFANVILDSVSPEGIRLTTIHMRYWRGIHAEIMTHRVFSRNARSSRAVPTQTMINEVASDPFIPKHWGKNQKGMQASEECNETVYVVNRLDANPNGALENIKVSRETAWRNAAEAAVQSATGFMEAGYHKQVANRLLEPFMMIDTLITSTDWTNFFALRTDSAAEPHFQDLANMTELAMKISKPNQLLHYQWHRPYIEYDDTFKVAKHLGQGVHQGDPEFVATLNKLSAARCARLSYKPFDGNDSIEAELKRYDLLVNNGLVHASPLEHQAQPDTGAICVDASDGPKDRFAFWQWNNAHQHGNFNGWRQARKMIANESAIETNRKKP